MAGCWWLSGPSLLTLLALINAKLVQESRSIRQIFSDNSLPVGNVDFNPPRNTLFGEHFLPDPVREGRLYDYVGDAKLRTTELNGKLVDLGFSFPYFGGRYNYTLVSQDGYVTFGTVLPYDDIRYGKDVNWPQEVDPALIAVYALRQKPALLRSVSPDDPLEYHQGIFFRVVVSTAVRQSASFKAVWDRQRSNNAYYKVDQAFLDRVTLDLRDGMAGASQFTPTGALVVTWVNMTFLIAGNADESRATYQLVLLTDGALSYVIINYYELGYATNDIQGDGVKYRAKSEFNGGNHTGVWYIDPVHSTATDPRVLASYSAVPHQATGRYMARVDERIQRGGCTNMSSDYPLTVHPQIVNMLESRIEVNGPCFLDSSTVDLAIAMEKTGKCYVINPAKAVCVIPRNYYIGTREARLSSPDSSKKQFTSFYTQLYYVPPTDDPYRIRLPDIHDWFRLDPNALALQWDPRNFSQINYDPLGRLLQVEPTRLVHLELWGYRETEERGPVFAKIGSFDNVAPVGLNEIRNTTIEATAHLLVQQGGSSKKLLNFKYDPGMEWGHRDFRFGLLRMAGGKIRLPDQSYLGFQAYPPDGLDRTVLWSAPIGLQWLKITPNDYDVNQKGKLDVRRIQQWAKEQCINWFDYDGTMDNFMQYTEMNASCPCREEQARIDLGRFMPHPRCNFAFKNLDCDLYEGALNCYLSAQNIKGFHSTNHGQVCCYHKDGYLMHTNYRPLMEADTAEYSPGFPQRAYEYGTAPYFQRWQVPGLSHYENDVMPYFLCCKWSTDYCKFFYWRRPSSGCTNYQPPAIGAVFGIGHVLTFDGGNYTFDTPGTFALVYKPETRDIHGTISPKVVIQIRTEHYPNRGLDFLDKDLDQASLIQPTNATVITGVALQEGDTDLVQVFARKDLRRSRYRLNLFIRGEMVFLDTLPIQRYHGVTVYINRGLEAHSELYVVLEKSKIGVRIRESHADYFFNDKRYIESLGLLDVMVALPPDYLPANTRGMYPDQGGSYTPRGFGPSNIDYRRVVTGLLGTYTGEVSDDWQTGPTAAGAGAIQVQDSTFPGSASRFPITSSQATSYFGQWKVDGNFFHDLFHYESRPNTNPLEKEQLLLREIYPYAAYYERTLPPKSMDAYAMFIFSGVDYDKLSTYCTISSRLMQDKRICPDMRMLQAFCTNKPAVCSYDYILSKMDKIAGWTMQDWKDIPQLRALGTRRYMSCGAISVEHPDNMLVIPAIGSMYLEGDEITLQCFPSYWMKGDSIYRCRDGRWNEGWQPWCRARSYEYALKILAIVFGVVLILGVIVAIFICCYCLRRRKANKRTYRTAQPQSLTYALNLNQPPLYEPMKQKQPNVYAPSSPQKGEPVKLMGRASSYDKGTSRENEKLVNGHPYGVNSSPNGNAPHTETTSSSPFTMPKMTQC